MIYRRVNVRVNVHFDIYGAITPRSIVWEDGTIYEIDRVLEVRRAASIKAGGIGTRYTVRIRGHERYLYFENPLWFVEVPDV